MNALEIYSAALDEFNAKNFDTALTSTAATNPLSRNELSTRRLFDGDST